MQSLVTCDKCKSQISDTAIICPICLKKFQDKDSLSKKIAASSMGTVGLLLTGPAGIATGLMGGILDFDSKKALKKLSKRNNAIDYFDLSNEFSVLVTGTHFIILIEGAGSTAELYKFYRNDLHKIYIDENKSRARTGILREKTIVKLEYFDTKKNRDICQSYKYKGKSERLMAEWAIIKFNEYKTKFNDNSGIKENNETFSTNLKENINTTDIIPDNTTKETKSSIINIDSFEQYINKGILLYKEKRFGDALINFEKAIELNDKNAFAFYYIAHTYNAIGVKTKVLPNLKMAARLGHKKSIDLLRKRNIDY